MSQTPQSSWGPKCMVTLTPAVTETDRGVALPHNAQAPTSLLLLLALPQELLSSGPLGPEALSFPGNHCPLNSTLRPLGERKGSGTFSPSPYLPLASPGPHRPGEQIRLAREQRGKLVMALHPSQLPPPSLLREPRQGCSSLSGEGLGLAPAPVSAQKLQRMFWGESGSVWLCGLPCPQSPLVCNLPNRL